MRCGGGCRGGPSCVKRCGRVLLSLSLSLFVSVRDVWCLRRRNMGNANSSSGAAPEHTAPPRDAYGFERSEEHQRAAILYRTVHAKVVQARDKEWSVFLKEHDLPTVSTMATRLRGRPVVDEDDLCTLQRLVRTGVPVAFRGLLWPLLSGADERQRAVEALATVFDTVQATGRDERYVALVERAGLDPSAPDACGRTVPPAGIPASVWKDIQKDIDRTFPGHALFAQGADGPARLQRILTAFAITHPRIGYCQSLNFLVASFMCLYMREEDCYYMTCALVDNVLPPDYYTQRLLGMHVDQRIILRLVKGTSPNPSAHVVCHQHRTNP